MKHLLSLLFLLFALASCKTAQQATTERGTTAPAANHALAYAKTVVATAQTSPCLTAKINMQLDAKGKSITCGGSLRMKRDDVVQLSLTFLGMEVGRMEFSPADVLIIDRFHKQYVRAKYADVSFLAGAGLDFYALQSLFWNELFVPGQKDVTTALPRFTTASAGDHTLLQLTDAPKLDYGFLTITASRLIDRLTVEAKSGSDKGQFVWRYGDFTKFNGKQFPTTMQVNFNGAGQNAGFTLSLSRLGTDSDWEPHTTVSSKYTERKVEEVLGRLTSLQ